MNADSLYKKGRRLEYFLVSYNFAEAIASLLFGSIAGSIALIGFGLDSLVEIMSSVFVIWRLRQHGKVSQVAEERIERRAVKAVAIGFFILGFYVLYESTAKLVFGEIPSPTLPGIIIATASIIVMPWVGSQTGKIGKQINSRALVADSKETIACAFLSVALLLGLGTNYLLGFWQADPIVGLIIVAFLLREGWECWKESGEEKEEES